jgi:hypothetical protein
MTYLEELVNDRVEFVTFRQPDLWVERYDLRVQRGKTFD